mgnify:CR=1 FL=1
MYLSKHPELFRTDMSTLVRNAEKMDVCYLTFFLLHVSLKLFLTETSRHDFTQRLRLQQLLLQQALQRDVERVASEREKLAAPLQRMPTITARTRAMRLTINFLPRAKLDRRLTGVLRSKQKMSP